MDIYSIWEWGTLKLLPPANYTAALNELILCSLRSVCVSVQAHAFAHACEWVCVCTRVYKGWGMPFPVREWGPKLGALERSPECVCLCVCVWVQSELSKGPCVLFCSTSMGRQAGFGPDSTRIKGFLPDTLYPSPDTHTHTHTHACTRARTPNCTIISGD